MTSLYLFQPYVIAERTSEITLPFGLAVRASPSALELVLFEEPAPDTDELTDLSVYPSSLLEIACACAPMRPHVYLPSWFENSEVYNQLMQFGTVKNGYPSLIYGDDSDDSLFALVIQSQDRDSFSRHLLAFFSYIGAKAKETLIPGRSPNCMLSTSTLLTLIIECTGHFSCESVSDILYYSSAALH